MADYKFFIYTHMNFSYTILKYRLKIYWFLWYKYYYIKCTCAFCSVLTHTSSFSILKREEKLSVKISIEQSLT